MVTPSQSPERKCGSVFGLLFGAVLIGLLLGYGFAYTFIGMFHDAGPMIVREYESALPVRIFTPAAFVEAKFRRKKVYLQRFVTDTDSAARSPDEYPVYLAKP